MLRLAAKAFWPARLPFPVLHVDTGHNFPEVIEYRDKVVSDLQIDLVIGSVPSALDSGRVQASTVSYTHLTLRTNREV